ncbi:PIN domain-like protein [Apiospora marii]|uniref:PIN domain-like protein n=1 Tax=Apiospora marii TaxID=335849 RepID=A0ABR1R234_9PEZI
MSTDGDAFLFGAQTVLRGLNAKNQVCMVEVFKMEDLKRAKPPLTQRVIFAMAILAGGDYSTGLPGCGPELALKIGTSNHGGLLWTLAEKEALRAEKFPIWRSRLAKDLKEGKFGRKEVTLAAALGDHFPDLAVVGYYIREMKKSTTTPAIDWNKDVDVPGLRQFTRVYFDWKYRHFAVKFVRTTDLCLLVRRLLRCIASGTDGSKWVTVQKIKTKGEGAAKEIRVKPNHAVVVPVDVMAEPIVDAYKGNLKKEEMEEDLEWLPFWLVEKACPALFQPPTEAPISNPKRKAEEGGPSEGEAPKRGRGRPPKDRAAADSARPRPATQAQAVGCRQQPMRGDT